MTQPQPNGYLALPPTGKGPGVLVLHAWWGLNDTIKSVCNRLAEAGYVAFAADLYHGKVADTIPGAEVLGLTVDNDPRQAQADVVAAVKFLSERSDSANGIAVVAFSLGGYFALVLSAAMPERVRSVVLYYGTEGTMGTDFSPSKANYLGHFAENDKYETRANSDSLEASLKRASRPVTFYIYPNTDHWFSEPDRTDAYNEAAATLAWKRTLAFLKENLNPDEPRWKKADLLNWLHDQQRQWESLLAEFGPERLEQTGMAGGHASMKDLVAHLTGWNGKLVTQLQAAQRGESGYVTPWPATLKTDDDINAWIYTTNHGRSLREVLDESQEVFNQLFATLESLPDDIQIDTIIDNGREFHPLWVGGQRIPAGEFFYHLREDHASDVRAWLAQGAKP
jgi:carboxymethylenebutenolidase